MSLPIDFLPNPLETIKPTDTWEALEDAVKYMAKTMPRADVIEHLRAMNVANTVLTLQGHRVETEPDTNPVAAHIAATLAWCRRELLWASPIEAVILTEGVRQEFLNGGMGFVGEERPDKIPYAYSAPE